MLELTLVPATQMQIEAQLLELAIVPATQMQIGAQLLAINKVVLKHGLVILFNNTIINF